MAALLALSNLFVYCYYGCTATESYAIMAKCLYESNWLEMSIDLKKYLILMIQNTQKPVFYSAYGVARLDLETFAQVIMEIA